MNILLVALMMLAPITAISDGNIIHIQEGGDIAKEQLSQLKMQRNLIDTARKYHNFIFFKHTLFSYPSIEINN